MQKSTFKLTKHELEFISEPLWMSIKQKIIHNISNSLHGLGEWMMKEYYADVTQSYKVTKGENYLDMPYLVLDTPQFKANELSGKLRIMVWWGHYISLQFFVKTSTVLWDDVERLKDKNYIILITNDLFNNDLDSDSFQVADAVDRQQLQQLAYTKICMKVVFEDIEHIQSHIKKFMNDMMMQA